MNTIHWRIALAAGAFLLYLSGFLVVGYAFQSGQTEGLLVAVGIGCIGIGAYQFVGRLRALSSSDRLPHSYDGAVEIDVDELGGVSDQWKQGRLVFRENTQNGSLLTPLFNLVMWPLAGYLFYDHFLGAQHFDGTPWLVLVFPAAGLYMIVHAVRKHIRRDRYGVTLFERAPQTGRAGETLEGLLRTCIPASREPENGFYVTLSCVHRYVLVTRGADGSRSRDTREVVLWSDARRMRGAAHVDSDELSIPVFFHLPSDQPELYETPEKGTIFWRLNVKADFPGADYAARFAVPIGEHEQETSSRAVDVHADPFSTDFEASETLFGDPIPPYHQFEIEQTEQDVLSDGVTMRRLANGGLSFYFGPLRRKVIAFMLLFWAAIFLGLFAVAAHASSIFGMIGFGLVGGFFLYVALRYFFIRTTALVEPSGITVRTKLFRTSTEEVPREMLRKVDVVPVSDWHEVHLFLDLSSRPDLQRKQERKIARYAWIQDTIKSLGIGRDTGDPRSVKEHLAATGSVPDRVVVGRYISDKVEADWIAEQMEEALARTVPA